MTLINTVLGSIDTSALGGTLTHEHLFVGPAGSYKEHPELLDKNVFENKMAILSVKHLPVFERHIDVIRQGVRDQVRNTYQKIVKTEI